MIRAELLQDATDAIVKRLTFDDSWVFQEKHNGDRRLIEKQGDTIRDFNRNGERGKGLPPSVIAALRKHPMHRFIIDTELVGETVFVFDILFYGDEATVVKPYSYRNALVQSEFVGYRHITAVYSAHTPEEKVRLITQAHDDNAEGFVMKDLRAQYRPADNNQRFNYRYKFWKTLDAVVIGDSIKRVGGKLRDSVRLGCYDSKGMLKDICGSTKKSAFPLLRGDVVELKYLYGTKTFDVVQPTILRRRSDKRATDCTLDQIIINKNWRKV